MTIRKIRTESGTPFPKEQWTVAGENGAVMAHGSFATIESMYAGNYIRSLAVGGLGTEPQYRRRGCVRLMFEEAFARAGEEGWAVAFLHPFSFSYYRQFGFEKVSDHRIVEFPMSAIGYIERCADLTPFGSLTQAQDLLDIYEAFSRGRNIMFRRYGAGLFSQVSGGGKPGTYIWYDAQGKPASYITLSVENEFHINRMRSINLHVYEMAFTSPQSLRALFGFIRMYEGELETVKIHNCTMSPEIDMVLSRYTHTSYTDVPDVMARILDTGAMLRANRYPLESGRFVLKAVDPSGPGGGVFRVEYGGGEALVEKLPDASGFNIAAEIPSLTQMLYGYSNYHPENAAYLRGVELKTPARDFFRAFPKRENGLFEHF
ncbi:MAG TPA: GNAT family N-acetyltransferase [Clostridiales bacterium]|nr:GNAT family N-acetyltransferase [Clostridiales bacterium]